jgi:hypothetical protein
MEFLVYSRAAPNAAATEDEDALNEAHWAYMDRFADGMVARGPTLGPDRATWTGSIHIVDLPDSISTSGSSTGSSAVGVDRRPRCPLVWAGRIRR